MYGNENANGKMNTVKLKNKKWKKIDRSMKLSTCAENERMDVLNV